MAGPVHAGSGLLMSPVKIGIVGCGRIARTVHVPIVSRMPRVELAALADPDAQRLEEAMRKAPHARPFRDYRELLALADLDAVVICLPNAKHAEAAVMALQRGKHVYLEKPIAMSLKEGREILDAWRSSGLVGMIGYHLRFNKLYLAARREIQSGGLGDLVGVRSVFSTSARDRPAWQQRRATGGGALLDLACHHIDLVRFLFGREIQQVYADVHSHLTEGDSVGLAMRLSGGLLVQSFFSMASVEEDRFEIFGRSGKLRVDRYLSLHAEISGPSAGFGRLNRLVRAVKSLAHAPYLLEKLRFPAHEPSYAKALAHFADAVGRGAQASPDFDDGYLSLAVVEAAEESARTGRAISLSATSDAG